MPSSNCTIGLLIHASQAAYRIKKDNLIDPAYSEAYAQTLVDIAEQGYSIADSIAPLASKGTGKTSLAALCLMPQDKHSPLIISFRGTKTGSDVISDIRLSTLGVVEKQFRDAAFEFYRKMRIEYPEREIVLTGHSLGGHLAQYVATKAYNTDPYLVNNPLVQIRTFNTAPIDTKHRSIFSTYPHLLSQIVNYRLSPDVVSDLPLQYYYGNTFVFPCDKGALASHPMGAVRKYLPAEILSQTVGSSDHCTKKQDMLVELMRGVVFSYQCRVEGQFFSRYRAGVKNLAEFEKALPVLISAINEGHYDAAQSKLLELNRAVNGLVSKAIIEVLIHDVTRLKMNVQAQTTGVPQEQYQSSQDNFKSIMNEFRAAETEHDNTQLSDSRSFNK